MSGRNIELENEIYEIEESAELNAFYLISILFHLNKCTLDQLAVSLFLFRFTNVTSLLIKKENYYRDFMNVISEWELTNIDTMLSPYLLEKYNSRFVKGLMDLMSKNLVKIDTDIITLNEERSSLIRNEVEAISKVYTKAQYIATVVSSSTVDEIKSKIIAIVGESK